MNPPFEATTILPGVWSRIVALQSDESFRCYGPSRKWGAGSFYRYRDSLSVSRRYAKRLKQRKKKPHIHLSIWENNLQTSLKSVVVIKITLVSKNIQMNVSLRGANSIECHHCFRLILHPSSRFDTNTDGSTETICFKNWNSQLEWDIQTFTLQATLRIYKGVNKKEVRPIKHKIFLHSATSQFTKRDNAVRNDQVISPFHFEKI